MAKCEHCGTAFEIRGREPSCPKCGTVWSIAAFGKRGRKRGAQRSEVQKRKVEEHRTSDAQLWMFADPALVRSVRNANALLVGGFTIVFLLCCTPGEFDPAFSFLLTIPGAAMAIIGIRMLNRIICRLAKENRVLGG